MKILHLTDFHYRNNEKNQEDQTKVIDALIADLRSDQIEYLFFTGDLVFSGEKPSDFIDAKNNLIDKLSNTLKIKKENVFICCGNHDIHRGQELIDTADKIKELKNNSELELFLNRQNGQSFKESLKNLKNYISFQKIFYDEYSPAETNVIEDLYTVHFRSNSGTKLAILTINSSWRAIDSDTDRGNLLYPVSILKKALSKIRDKAEFKIILMHHPISDFRDWNCSELEDIIHDNFHLLFSGHLHKKKQSIHLTRDEGIFCCTSPATLSDDGTQIGYAIIDVDTETYEIEITNRIYSKQDNSFYHAKESIKTSIPVGPEKKSSNNFKKILRKKCQEETQKANDLFISFDIQDSKTGFKNLFTTPILKNKSKAQLAKNHNDTPIIEIETLLTSKKNHVINGKDKSGKTSILVKMHIDLLQDFTIYQCIPLYFDAKEHFKSNKKLDIYRSISTYYEINNQDSHKLPEKYPFRILIDNYDPNHVEFNFEINEFLKTNQNAYFTVVTEEKISDTFTSYEFDGREYENLFIHEITRPEVRSLAGKWPNLTNDKKELILEKIYEIFTQLNIPKNYWTVSLFLWIFEKNNDANFHNSFELIQLYIDNLLDRKHLALDKSSKLKFDEYKAYLADLAYFLMYDRENKYYTATYSEIVTFTQEYRNRNKRFVIEVKDIIDLIINKGIIKQVFEGSYTFRLNGVFEYFIALYMTKNETFRNKIIDDDHYYLSFKNELELYAGFKRDDENYLTLILKRTQSIFKNINQQYQNVNTDNHLKLKISEVFDISLPIQTLGQDFQKTYPIEKQDELLDDITKNGQSKSEVKVKEYYEKIEENSDNLSKALFILSRVFRNSNVQDSALISSTLDYILATACELGFKIIEEAEADPKMLSLENNEKLIVQLLTNYMPLIVQTFLYDAIAQNDLERIFKDKIEELSNDKQNNQFKLLILYFILIDLDITNNKKYIDDLIDFININALRQTTLLKLYYYLIFKCNNKPNLESFLKEKIRYQALKLNAKTDIGELQKKMNKTSRIARLNKNK